MNDDQNVTLGLKIVAGNALDTVNKMTDGIDKATNSIQNFGKEVKKAFNDSSIVGFIKNFQDLTNNMIRISKPQAEFIENLNLMEVAFNKNKDSAYALLDSMNEVFGLDPSKMSKQLGTYRQMASAMGIASDTADLLSENLLKMQEDVGSLYNLDNSVVATKFQSAMAGQSRAVRSLGVDITNTGLQNELYRRGIEATVDDLDSASKEILIYLTMEHQLQNAQGDLAKTTESVANQTKIFREQCDILGRQLGAFLIPILQTVLPVLNGIIMALNTIISIVLSFFHIDAKGLASQFGIAQVEAVDTGLGNLNKTLGKTSKTAKEAKKSLRGFDKLEAIYTPTKSSSGGTGGTGGVGGIGGNSDVYKKLRDQLKEYNNKMQEVQSKANKIKEAILEALGFTKQLNGQWKFTHLTIWSVLAILAGVGGVIWAVSTIYKVIKRIGNIGKGLGIGSKLLKKKDVADTVATVNGAGDIGDAVNDNADAFKLPSFGTVLKGIAELALIIGALTAIVVAIGALCKNKSFSTALTGGIKQVGNLSKMLATSMIPIGLFCAGIVVLGKVDIPNVFAGMVSFTAILVGLEGIVGLIGMLSTNKSIGECINGGIETVENLATMLTKTLFPLSLFCVGVVGLGMVAVPAITGLGVFTALIFGLCAVVEALGVLKATNGFTETVADGGEVLLQLADILGGFFGTIVSSFADKATDFLPDLGKKMSDFATNLQGFVSLSKDIDPNIGTTMKSLSEALFVMTAQNLLDSITKFVTGKSSIEEFGKSLKTFGKDFAEYAEEISGIGGDVVTASTNVAKATETIAVMAKKIPNDGGVVGVFVGNNNIGIWSASLPIFATNFKLYANTIAGYNDTTSSDNVVKAMNKFVKFAKDIPNEGGVVSWFTGDNGIKAFGKSLADFGKNFKSYSDKVSNLSFDKISRTTDELRKIVNVANEIKSKGLSSVLGDFGYTANYALQSFTNAFSKANGNNIGYTFGNAMANSIISSLKNKAFPTIKLTNTDGELITKAKISVYANGGFPEDGLFFANHNEMVGKFSNGKTAVANNDQIVKGISVGVASAIQSTRKSNQPININVKADDDSIAKYLQFKINQNDRQYGF